MHALFEYTAQQWALPSADSDTFLGLRVFGVDGSCLRVADSEQNETYFGRPSGGKDPSAGGYPVARIVALMALKTRLILGAVIGPFTCAETVLAKELWPLLPENSLVIFDRGFVDYSLFCDIQNSGKADTFCHEQKRTWHSRWSRT